MPRSSYGGRHELGQNFLNHRPTINRIASLVASTEGAILEIGSGDGALTRALYDLRRPLTAIDIDEHRVQHLRRSLPGVSVKRADALRYPIDAAVIVGNVPFHLTTPILRRLLTKGSWQSAFLLTQWEVARKRAGVGGSTMMTAQTVPWFTFTLHDRVPAHRFTPRPSVDGGIIAIRRRETALLPRRARGDYERFVRSMFTGAGGSMTRILPRATGLSREKSRRALMRNGVSPRSLPRDLTAQQWAGIYRAARNC